MPRGGRRPGAGRKKGSPSLLDKEEARKALRELVLAKLGPMVEAQMANAQGVKYLVWRDKKTGKFKPVPENQLEQLNATDEVIEIWAEKPNVAAFADLMDRTLDKAPQPKTEVGLSGKLVVEWEK